LAARSAATPSAHRRASSRTCVEKQNIRDTFDAVEKERIGEK
jgi:hypothetical protein